MRLTPKLFALPTAALLLSACLTQPGMLRPRGVEDAALPADYLQAGPTASVAPARRTPRSGELRTEIYDVRDLIAPRAEFLPPRVSGLPTESDDERSAAGSEGEPRPFIEPDMLVYTVELATGPAYWAETDGASIEISQGGMLIVRANPAIHERIGGALR